MIQIIVITMKWTGNSSNFILCLLKDFSVVPLNNGTIISNPRIAFPSIVEVGDESTTEIFESHYMDVENNDIIRFHSGGDVKRLR